MQNENSKISNTIEYTSINGFKIITFEQETENYPIELKDQFICPISQDVASFPVYLKNSGNIYDRENITEWLATSNIEPVTGIELEEGKIEYLPVLNYFLACLCLEEDEKSLIFHAPNADILTLFKFTQYFYKGCVIDPNIFRKTKQNANRRIFHEQSPTRRKNRVRNQNHQGTDRTNIGFGP